VIIDAENPLREYTARSEVNCLNCSRRLHNLVLFSNLHLYPGILHHFFSIQNLVHITCFSHTCWQLSFAFVISTSDRGFFFNLCGGTLGTAATTGLVYQPRMIGDGDCGEIGGINIDKGNGSTRRQSATTPLCPPQIPQVQPRV
jgi:hypothetical protein